MDSRSPLARAFLFVSLSLCGVPSGQVRSADPSPSDIVEIQEFYVAADGEVVLTSDASVLSATGLRLIDGGQGQTLQTLLWTFRLDTSTAMYEIVATNGQLAALIGGELDAVGPTLAFINKSGEQIRSNRLYIVHDPSGASPVEFRAFADAGLRSHWFDLTGADLAFDHKGQVLTISADVFLAQRYLDQSSDAPSAGGSDGARIGRVDVTVRMQLSQTLVIGPDHTIESATMHPVLTPSPEGGFPSPGPDVIVGDLPATQQFGRVGTVGSGTVGLAIGTTSCNKGNTPFNWFALPDTDHPMIPMNLYRLKTVANAERFEQIGQSWMKHGFTALQQDACGFGCTPTGGTHLGVGCSDPYSVSLNASQCGLGPRAALNPYTGVIPGGANLGGSPCGSSNYPSRDHRTHSHDGVSHRLQVLDVDLDPGLNPGARYFAEGHYLTPHEFDDPDAFANQNMHNNVSHREVAVSGPVSGVFSFGNVGATVRESPAVDAWTTAAQTLIEPEPFVDGRAFLAYEVTDLGGGLWHYEFAVYNMNLDRSIHSFSIPVHPSVTVTNIGSHFPLNHTAEANTPTYSNMPWTVDTSGGAVTWSTDDFATDPNANAIRFATLYNFRFDANSGPQAADATIGLFKTATTTLAATLGPTPIGPPPVCGNNVVEAGEQCDDGNTAPGDGCDANCQIETECGNGVVEFGEDCDDANTSNTDACLNTCVAASCGDGFVQAGVEQCDASGQSATCDADCTFAVCGDGTLNVTAGEECDDGNTASGDGCDGSCQTESNDLCADALVILEGSTSFDTTGANTDGPAHGACQFDGQTYHDIWYDYTAPCSGNLTLSLCGSGYDTDLVIYDGCNCPVSDANLLACNDDNCPGGAPASYRSLLPSASYPAVPVTAGNCYKIRVGGWNSGDQGTGTLTISNDGSPCPPACQDPCDDGDACTTNDMCVGDVCVGGPPPDCTDDTCTDCNANGIKDQCEGLGDCNADGVPDQCQAGDCNGNGVNDICDIAGPTSNDCDGGPVGNPAGGAVIFGNVCMFCHGADGSGGVGPDIRDHTRVQIWNKLLPPTTHAGGAHPEYNAQDFADIEAFLASAGSRGRPDLAPDECQTLTDCDSDGTPDGCELEAGTQVDLDHDGVPDDCQCTDPCSDGDACTTGDACAGGTCVGGGPTDCDDNNACTVDSCDSATGCIHTAVDPAVDCNDNDACTVDTCDPVAGCVNTAIDPATDCNDGNACTADTCDPVAGCVNTAIDPATDCNDNNACTIDSCDPVAGCVNTAIDPATDCNDNNACTVDTCDPDAGCVNTAIDPATDCNDNNACTVDTCDPVAGCVNTPIDPAIDCNDGNACTVDTCDAAAGCVNTPIDPGTDCDDGNLCTTDGCDPASGCVNTPQQCPPGEVCDPADGQCKPCLTAGDCDDGDFCNGAEQCDAVLGCVAGPDPCDDGIACTVDACNETTDTCVPVPFNSLCDNGLYCDGAEICDVQSGCQPATPIDCDDDNVCTSDSCNETTDTCDHIDQSADCEDGNPCTDHSCDPVAGCITTNNTAPCNDGNACTDPDTCGGGFCSGVPIICNDGDDCTIDSCDPQTGCVSDCAPAATPCDAGIGPGSGECDGACVCVDTTVSCAGGTAATCCDTDANGVRDDACVWCDCVADACVYLDVPFADVGGPFGDCVPDGFCNIHDANHALACFAGTNGCADVNVDAGGPFGDCNPDGFCNIHDANHALVCFAGTSPCACPGQPSPVLSGPVTVAATSLTVVADRRTVRPGDLLFVRVFLGEATRNLQSYQLDLSVTGGRRGQLALMDVSVENRPDQVFGQGLDSFRAFNVSTGRMLSGLYTAGVATARGAYLATFVYRVSGDAAGVFTIDVRHDEWAGDQTFLVSDFTKMIDVLSVRPAVIVVTEEPSRSFR